MALPEESVKDEPIDVVPTEKLISSFGKAILFPSVNFAVMVVELPTLRVDG